MCKQKSIASSTRTGISLRVAVNHEVTLLPDTGGIQDQSRSLLHTATAPWTTSHSQSLLYQHNKSTLSVWRHTLKQVTLKCKSQPRWSDAPSQTEPRQVRSARLDGKAPLVSFCPPPMHTVYCWYPLWVLIRVTLVFIREKPRFGFKARKELLEKKTACLTSVDITTSNTKLFANTLAQREHMRGFKTTLWEKACIGEINP